MIPFACLSGFALYSLTSAISRILSSSSSIPIPVCADTGIHMTSPPQLSGISSYFVSSCRTASGFAPCLSILLIATIISSPASLAWLIASTVCGIIPSSAATTSIAISVAFAPRARIAVNAAWPGVSRNVISFPFIFTLYAPICCVIPPASSAVTFEFLILSSREVFPWSTCPITTTTGARSVRFSSLSSVSSNSFSSIVTTTSLVAFAPRSSAIYSAVSKSRVCVTFAITPAAISLFITSVAVTFNREASSRTVISSGIVI